MSIEFKSWRVELRTCLYLLAISAVCSSAATLLHDNRQFEEQLKGDGPNTDINFTHRARHIYPLEVGAGAHPAENKILGELSYANEDKTPMWVVPKVEEDRFHTHHKMINKHHVEDGSPYIITQSSQKAFSRKSREAEPSRSSSHLEPEPYFFNDDESDQSQDSAEKRSRNTNSQEHLGKSSRNTNSQDHAGKRFRNSNSQEDLGKRSRKTNSQEHAGKRSRNTDSSEQSSFDYGDVRTITEKKLKKLQKRPLPQAVAFVVTPESFASLLEGRVGKNNYELQNIHEKIKSFTPDKSSVNDKDDDKLSSNDEPISLIRNSRPDKSDDVRRDFDSPPTTSWDDVFSDILSMEEPDDREENLRSRNKDSRNKKPSSSKNPSPNRGRKNSDKFDDPFTSSFDDILLNTKLKSEKSNRFSNERIEKSFSRSTTDTGLKEDPFDLLSHSLDPILSSLPSKGGSKTKSTSTNSASGYSSSENKNNKPGNSRELFETPGGSTLSDEGLSTAQGRSGKENERKRSELRSQFSGINLEDLGLESVDRVRDRNLERERNRDGRKSKDKNRDNARDRERKKDTDRDNGKRKDNNRNRDIDKERKTNVPNILETLDVPLSSLNKKSKNSDELTELLNLLDIPLLPDETGTDKSQSQSRKPKKQEVHSNKDQHKLRETKNKQRPNNDDDDYDNINRNQGSRDRDDGNGSVRNEDRGSRNKAKDNASNRDRKQGSRNSQNDSSTYRDRDKKKKNQNNWEKNSDRDDQDRNEGDHRKEIDYFKEDQPFSSISSLNEESGVNSGSSSSSEEEPINNNSREQQQGKKGNTNNRKTKNQYNRNDEEDDDRFKNHNSRNRGPTEETRSKDEIIDRFRDEECGEGGEKFAIEKNNKNGGGRSTYKYPCKGKAKSGEKKSAFDSEKRKTNISDKYKDIVANLNDNPNLLSKFDFKLLNRSALPQLFRDEDLNEKLLNKNKNKNPNKEMSLFETLLHLHDVNRSTKKNSTEVKSTSPEPSSHKSEKETNNPSRENKEKNKNLPKVRSGSGAVSLAELINSYHDKGGFKIPSRVEPSNNKTTVSSSTIRPKAFQDVTEGVKDRTNLFSISPTQLPDLFNIKDAGKTEVSALITSSRALDGSTKKNSPDGIKVVPHSSSSFTQGASPVFINSTIYLTTSAPFTDLLSQFDYVPRIRTPSANNPNINSPGGSNFQVIPNILKGNHALRGLLEGDNINVTLQQGVNPVSNKGLSGINDPLHPLNQISSPHPTGVTSPFPTSVTFNTSPFPSTTPFPSTIRSATPFTTINPNQHISFPTDRLGNPISFSTTSSFPTSNNPTTQFHTTSQPTTPFPTQNHITTPFPTQNHITTPFPTKHHLTTPFPTQHPSATPFPIQHNPTTPFQNHHRSTTQFAVPHQSTTSFPIQHHSTTPFPNSHHPTTQFQTTPRPTTLSPTTPGPSTSLRLNPLSITPHPDAHFPVTPQHVQFSSNPTHGSPPNHNPITFGPTTPHFATPFPVTFSPTGSFLTTPRHVTPFSVTTRLPTSIGPTHSTFRSNAYLPTSPAPSGFPPEVSSVTSSPASQIIRPPAKSRRLRARAKANLGQSNSPTLAPLVDGNIGSQATVLPIPTSHDTNPPQVIKRKRKLIRRKGIRKVGENKPTKNMDSEVSLAISPIPKIMSELQSSKNKPSSQIITTQVEKNNAVSKSHLSARKENTFPEQNLFKSNSDPSLISKSELNKGRQNPRIKGKLIKKKFSTVIPTITPQSFIHNSGHATTPRLINQNVERSKLAKQAIHSPRPESGIQIKSNPHSAVPIIKKISSVPRVKNPTPARGSSVSTFPPNRSSPHSIVTFLSATPRSHVSSHPEFGVNFENSQSEKAAGLNSQIGTLFPNEVSSFQGHPFIPGVGNTFPVPENQFHDQFPSVLSRTPLPGGIRRFPPQSPINQQFHNPNPRGFGGSPPHSAAHLERIPLTGPIRIDPHSGFLTGSPIPGLPPSAHRQGTHPFFHIPSEPDLPRHQARTSSPQLHESQSHFSHPNDDGFSQPFEGFEITGERGRGSGGFRARHPGHPSSLALHGGPTFIPFGGNVGPEHLLTRGSPPLRNYYLQDI